MYGSRLKIDPKEAKRLLEENNKNYFPTVRFNFLNSHSNFRPGKSHVLLGTTGSGKSTLTRAILRQLADGNKVLYYSTEETVEDIKMFFARSGVTQKQQQNIIVVYEGEMLRDFDYNDIHGWMGALFDTALGHGVDIIVIDNISTSKFYGDDFKKGGDFLRALAKFKESTKLPVFMIIHTKTGIHDGQSELIGPDDVRGYKLLSVEAEYFYIYQRHRVTANNGDFQYRPFITIAKSRLHDSQGEIYYLKFNHEKKTYVSDMKVDFNAFKEAFDERDRLK